MRYCRIAAMLVMLAGLSVHPALAGAPPDQLTLDAIGKVCMDLGGSRTCDSFQKTISSDQINTAVTDLNSAEAAWCKFRSSTGDCKCPDHPSTPETGRQELLLWLLQTVGTDLKTLTLQTNPDPAVVSHAQTYSSASRVIAETGPPPYTRQQLPDAIVELECIERKPLQKVAIASENCAKHLGLHDPIFVH